MGPRRESAGGESPRHRFGADSAAAGGLPLGSRARAWPPRCRTGAGPTASSKTLAPRPSALTLWWLRRRGAALLSFGRRRPLNRPYTILSVTVTQSRKFKSIRHSTETRLAARVRRPPVSDLPNNLSGYPNSTSPDSRKFMCDKFLLNSKE